MSSIAGPLKLKIESESPKTFRNKTNYIQKLTD